MVFTIAASSFYHSVKTISVTPQKNLDETFKAIPGLSFNLNANNQQKTFQNHFKIPQNKQKKNEKRIVHLDVVISTVSMHK